MAITRQQIAEAIEQWEEDRIFTRNGHGRGLWCALRISPDGEVRTECAASPCFSEDEYYGRTPHTATIRTAKECTNLGPDSPIEWEQCDEDEAEFYRVPDSHGDRYWALDDERRPENAKPYRLSDCLLNPVYIDACEIDEAIEICKRAGIEVEEEG